MLVLVRIAILVTMAVLAAPLSAATSLSTEQHVIAVACSRNSSLPYCPPKAFGSRTAHGERIQLDEKEAITDNDKIACRELRDEYRKSCASADRRSADTKEFCEAFENVCFNIPESEPDQPTQSPPVSARPKDYTAFCKEYKQRYLYVCPDPFRFGQRAAVFCPLYSERCHIPLPEKPVVPTRKPNHRSTIKRMCSQYRNFAVNYCQNPFVLTQAQYRDGCDKYYRFCTHRQG